MANVLLRHAALSDLAMIQHLFVDTVTHVCARDYGPEQLGAWASGVKHLSRWTNKLATQYFLVAVASNQIVGFGSLDGAAYIDLLYVHKDYQRQGIAHKLYSALEEEAIRSCTTAVTADVSKTAKAFFEGKGFKTITAQARSIDGVEIINYKMEKNLQP